jgi:hypothetical protein
MQSRALLSRRAILRLVNFNSPKKFSARDLRGAVTGSVRNEEQKSRGRSSVGLRGERVIRPSASYCS